MKTVSASVLKSLLDQGRQITIIDVLPEQYYQSCHMAGAVNYCVYEVVFLDRVKADFRDKGASLAVYSSSHRCMAAQDAAEKLVSAGYQDVTVCMDGIEGWAGAGYPVEGSGGPQPASPDVLEAGTGELDADIAESRVEWFGRSRTVRHRGTVSLARGRLVFRDGRLAAGAFTLDMRSIRNENLQDTGLRSVLEAHLSSRDFFHVDEYPEATFETTRVLPLAGSSPGMPNYDVEGRLGLRGQTRDLLFPATVERLDDGRIAVEAHFDLDRTGWGVIYGSGRFFEKLGMHLVHDLVSIQLRLVSMPGA
ncbi:MAG: YceI family protein [Thermodesulfobacteriota bacterium]|jgi:polyisoprenoid-binding protein YceI/rhodanese-related sulfurtransferase